MGCRHATNAQAEPDGHDRRQRLRDRRDGQRHGEQEQAKHDVESDDRGVEEAGGEHQGADAEHDHAQPLAGAVQFLLQRRRLPLGGLQEPGDAPDLGRHAGGDDDGTSAAVGGDGGRIEHVAAVAQAGFALDRSDLLRQRHALAGQGRFIGLEIRDFDKPGVGRNLVAGFDLDDVAGNEVMGRDALSLAVADDGRFGRGKCHQRAHRFLGARLLDEAERRVQGDDHQDDDRFVGQGAFARVLQQPLHHGDDDGDQQDDDEDVLELLQQAHPPRRFRRALELVRAICVEAMPGLGLAQALCRIGRQRGEHLIRGFAIWRGRDAGQVAADRGFRFHRILTCKRLMHVHGAILQKLFSRGHAGAMASQAGVR